MTTTCCGVIEVGTIARLSVVVAQGLVPAPPPAVWSVPHTSVEPFDLSTRLFAPRAIELMVPSVVLYKTLAALFATPETIRFVVLAVTAVTIVVDAYGSVEATPSPRMVVVAVRPIESASSTESCVVLACRNLFRVAVKILEASRSATLVESTESESEFAPVILLAANEVIHEGSA